MLPSSFMISHSTAAGCSPASCARSQQASVCPARTSTPPACAISGNTWPGWTMSAGVALEEAATLMVCARSAADIPVVTPEAASMDTVKLVPCTERLRATIGRRLRRSACASVIGMQTNPRPNFAMKFIFSAVTNSAAKMRSPSFSRSSSSTSTAMRPDFSSAMISWIELRLMVSSVRARILRLSNKKGALAPLAFRRAVRLLLAALVMAFDFLADARALARELAHIVELGAAHVAFPLQLDRIDRRGKGLEGALDALPRGHLAHGERGIDPAGLLSHVRPSDCFSRQRSICAWWPESSTGGTDSPAYVSGRVYCGQSSRPFTNESCAADAPSPSAPGNCRTTASIRTIAASSPPERT